LFCYAVAEDTKLFFELMYL